MDDFAVDLDKVLDDFELSEGDHGIQHNQHSHIMKDVRLDSPDHEQLPAATEKENNSCVPSLYDIPYDTHKTLDIVDGDFGPKGLGSDLQPKMNTADGGYFVPEGASDSADDTDDHMPGMLNGPAANMFCFEGPPVGHVGSGLSAFSVYDKHRNVDLAPGDAEFVPENHVTPELLHNAFDTVGLADPDSDTEPSMRPSFMSSSPPTGMTLGGISQPDVVPAMMDAQLNVSLPCCELQDDMQQAVAMSCSRDSETVPTNEVSEGITQQTMMAEDANNVSPHSSVLMNRSDSGELDKEVAVTNEERMMSEDAKELGDTVNLEDLTVENSGSDTADIIMDIQGTPQTMSGSSMSLPDVSNFDHPANGNTDQCSELMNICLQDKTSPVSFSTIETDDTGDEKMENCLAEMRQDSTCHKDLADSEQLMTVAEKQNVEDAPAVSPCNCDAMQNDQDTSGSAVAGVHQCADVEQDSVFSGSRDSLSGIDVKESSEQAHNASYPSEVEVDTASMPECLSVSSELKDSEGRCDLGERNPTQSVTDTVIATSVAENSSDALTSSSSDSTAVMSGHDDGSVVPEPVVGFEEHADTMAVEQDSNTLTGDKTRQCDIADESTHMQTDNVTKSEMVLENKADKPSDVHQPPLVIGQSLTMQGVGARPKEHVVRRNRPNSLLGLSKPDVGPVVAEKPVDGMGCERAAELGGGVMGSPMLGGALMGSPMSGIGDGVIGSPMSGLGSGLILENSHDLFNIQLAQQRARSPLQKQQLNLEIRQHHLGSDVSGETLDNKLLHNKSVSDTVSQSDTVPQVCSDDTLSPTLPQPNVVRSAKPPCSLDVSSSYSPVPPGGDAVAQQGGLSQQRRPCSLTLPPRGDFQPERHNLEDVDTQMVSDSPAATGDHVPSDTAASTTEAMPPSPAPGLVAPPSSSINPNLPITELGKVAPVWLPDSEAPNCMQCDAKFTFTRRRHHCRCCGKVFCSGCCNLKIALAYLEEKEARVCSCCYQDLIRAQVYERHHGAAAAPPRLSPNPNNPSEYCSTVPPLQQAQGHAPALPPTVMVPVGVLRKQGLQKKGEPKQVIFSDGIRPGGDLTELDGPSSQPELPVQKGAGRKMKKPDKTKQSDKTSPKNSKLQNSNKNRCLIPAGGLPPVILPTGVKGDFSLEENPESEKFMPQIRSTEDASPVMFAINKNLFVMVKIVNLDCCVNRVCMCFSTKGMCTVAQDEIVIILQCLPDEKTVPRDIFVHLFNVYDSAAKGNTVSNMDHSIFTENILGSKDYGGFLYIRPSFQCLHKLILPQPPYVIGILLQKWEIPWAKIFPVRLMLRLGAEYRYYPCPLISVRDRKPVYGEIGHTIMNLLADFRNYQYQLLCVRGLTVHMEEKKTYINLPRNRYNEVMKVISNSNDYVMAFGANFSQQADSHLVCIQNEDGNYQTQAINIQSKPRKVTGASFVVFNGALKASSGLRAKSSIVEDGLMVQVMAETMSALKQALHAMTDYTIGCGSLQTPEPEESVIVQWVKDDRNVNVGVKSPIDGKAMDGIQSIRIHSAMDCVGDNRTIRWTEVFFIENEDRGTSRCEPVDLSRLAETLARACCLALVPHLDLLRDTGLTRLALRATIDSERVGYEVGGKGSHLPAFYMNSLDSELIPVIHSAASSNQEGPIVLELIFHIIE